MHYPPARPHRSSRLFYEPRHSAHGARRLHMKRAVLIACLLLLLALLCYPFVEPHFLDASYQTITSSSLSNDIGTLRIVYLSDIHMGPFFSQSRANDLISRVNALNADLILLGGDYASNADGAVQFFKESRKFSARYAVCAVIGDADRAGGNESLSELRSAMINAGVTPVINDVVQVRIGNSSVSIAGVDDAVTGHAKVADVASQVKRDDYVIFLSHTPAVISDAEVALSADGYTSWFDLALFGHTHGGQAPLLGSLLGLTSGVPNRYCFGWLSENRVPMLTSGGIGTVGLPMRLFRRPQYHVITIKAGT